MVIQAAEKPIISRRCISRLSRMQPGTDRGYGSYDFFRYGDTKLYVSYGASGWRFPFRSEAVFHYKLITLEPTEQ